MTTFLSQEPVMYEAYNNKKDLYAMIAQSAFNNNYEDNLEFWPAGTKLIMDGKEVIAGNKTHKNPDGKARRSVGKVLNLAATYGMGGKTAGARLGKSAEEGEKLLDNFFKGFPKVKEAIEYSKVFLKENGYVEDFVGRRRHLDINIPKYTVELADKTDIFNPFFGCKSIEANRADIIAWNKMVDACIASSQASRKKRAVEAGQPKPSDNGEMSNAVFEKLQKLAINPTAYLPGGPLATVKWFTASDDAIKDLMKKKHIDYATAKTNLEMKSLTMAAHFKKVTGYDLPATKIVLSANTGKIAQAERQCFNARIQGSAASLTKMAMVDIFNSEELKKRDAHLIITVHDEVLVECPAIYADEVEEILPQIMIDAAKKGGDDVPQQCDPANESRWYISEYAAMVNDEYKKLLAGDKSKNIMPLSKEEALSKLILEHSEVPEKPLTDMILTGEPCDF